MFITTFSLLLTNKTCREKKKMCQRWSKIKSHFFFMYQKAMILFLRRGKWMTKGSYVWGLWSSFGMQLFEKGCPRLSVFCDRGRLKRLGRETKTKEIYPQFSSHFLSSCQPLCICAGIFQVLVPFPLNCVPLACSWACIALWWGGATCYHFKCCASTSCCNNWILKKFVSQKLLPK